MLVGKAKLLGAGMLVIFVLIFINLMTIFPLYPKNNSQITDKKPRFLWTGLQGCYVLYIDDNPEFRTPKRIELHSNSFKPEKEMDFGTYYWKVQSGPLISKVSKFEIVSSVILSRNKTSVKNEGNVNVTLHRLTGAIVLGIGKSADVGEYENVTAEQS